MNAVIIIFEHSRPEATDVVTLLSSLEQNEMDSSMSKYYIHLQPIELIR